MIDAIYGIASVALVGLLFFWLCLKKPVFRGVAGMVVTGLLFSSAAMVSNPASAVEIRRGDKGDDLTVSASEVIDDSMVLMGPTIIIEGTVNGDLIAAGQRIIMAGTVNGNLITFGQSVNVEGVVTGSVMTFGQSLEVEGEVGGSLYNFTTSTSLNNARLMRDLWSFTNMLRIDSGSEIDGNATMFLNNASIEGKVGRDVTSFGDRIEISGSVGSDVDAWSGNLTLRGGSSVDGNVTFHSNQEERLQRSDDAIVRGEIFLEPGFERQQRTGNRYINPGFYVSQIFRIAGAFIAGLCLFALFPGLKEISLGSGMQGLKSAGIGFLAIFTSPLAMVIMAVTILALPLAVISLFSWIILLYFAKIILAWIVGNMLVKQAEPSVAWPLMVGIAIITVIINLPAVGGILNFCMTLVGAGLLVTFLYRNFQTAGR